MTTLEIVTREIVDLHDFFTAWFNGTANRDELEPKFLSRMHKDLMFIPPEGQMMTAGMLKAGFDRGYGSNPDFRIAIRDVDVRYERDNLVLATYTEWQRGAALSASANNARVTTVLMELGDRLRWLHLQETWLPDAVRDAESFDF